MPQNPVTKKDMERVKEALMLAQIPYTVTWDSHWDSVSNEVYYDERITVAPFTYQHQRKIEET